MREAFASFGYNVYIVNFLIGTVGLNSDTISTELGNDTNSTSNSTISSPTSTTGSSNNTNETMSWASTTTSTNVTTSSNKSASSNTTMINGTATNTTITTTRHSWLGAGNNTTNGSGDFMLTSTTGWPDINESNINVSIQSALKGLFTTTTAGGLDINGTNSSQTNASIHTPSSGGLGINGNDTNQTNASIYTPSSSGPGIGIIGNNTNQTNASVYTPSSGGLGINGNDTNQTNASMYASSSSGPGIRIIGNNTNQTNASIYTPNSHATMVTTATSNTSTTTNTSSTLNTLTTNVTTSTTSNLTSTTSTSTTKLKLVIARLFLDNGVATLWTAHHHFSLDILGHSVAQGVLAIQEAPCGISVTSVTALQGSLGNPELVSSLATMAFDGIRLGGAYSTQRWTELRVSRGGSYVLCWCPSSPGFDCSLASAYIHLDIQDPSGFVVSNFEVHGPALELALRDDLGLILERDPSALGCPSLNETFAIQVMGVNLTEFDRLRVVAPNLTCGRDGTDENVNALQWLGAGMPGLPGIAGAESSRVWPGMTFRDVQEFRVCWCVGALVDNARGLELVHNLTVLTNGSNGSNGSDGSPIFAGIALSPPAFRHLASSDTLSNMSMADLLNSSNVSNDSYGLNEIYALNVTSLKQRQQTTCGNASDFDVDLGTFAVAGPMGVEATDHLNPKVAPRVGRNFSLAVAGRGLSATGRIRILAADGGLTGTEVSTCGLAINSTMELDGILAENPNTPGLETMAANTTQKSVIWRPLRIGRAGRYAVCWCSGRRTDCTHPSHFGTTAGNFIVVWAGAHAILDADGNELRAVPGVSFTIQIAGIELSALDRIRIVESSVACGGNGAAVNTAVLRGPLTHVPAHSGISYAPGALAGPGILRSDRARLSWPALRLYTGGVRRVCWCPGAGQSGSDIASCSRDQDFYYEVGTFDTIFVTAAWFEACARTWTPFRVHVAAVGLRPKIDRILIARSVDVCGEAMPRGLKPYGAAMDTARADWGFPAMGPQDCEEDPNAAATPGERKLVCGDHRNGTIQVALPGLYRICVCPRTPGYDCTDYSHYRLPAGDLFEIAGMNPAASGAWQDVVATSAAGGGAAQAPLILNGPGSAALVAEYAPAPLSGGTQAPSRLAVGSEDGVLRLWEPETPRLVAELVGHTGPILSIAWAPDSSFIVSGSSDGTMRLWSTVAGVAPGSQPAHVCPSWEKVWQRPGGDATVEVPHDWTVGGGDATDQEWQNAISYHLGSAVHRWLNLTRHGNASQSSTRQGASADRAIDSKENGDFAAGSCTHTHTQANPWWQVDLGGPYAVRGVKVTNRADCCGEWLSPFFIYVDGAHGTTECAGNVTIRQGETIDVPCDAVGHVVRIQLHKSEVLTLCEVGVRYQFTENVAASDDLRDLYQLTLTQAARHCEKACTMYRERALSMCNCGPTFECGVMHNCVPKCGLEEYEWLPAERQRVTAVAFIPLLPPMNASMLASASPDRTIRLWSIDPASRSLVPEVAIQQYLTSVNALAASPTMPGILASAGDDFKVIWHFVPAAILGDASREVLHTFANPLGGQSVFSLAFTLDGKWFAIAGNRSAALFHVASRSLHRTLEPAASTSIHSNGVSIGQTAPVARVVFSPDSNWLAFRLPTTVQLWQLSSVQQNTASGAPQAFGEWVRFTNENLSTAMVRWSVYNGPVNNRPVYSARQVSMDNVTLHFTPCNLTATAHPSPVDAGSGHACANDLPYIRVDVEVPFEFSAVRGNFTEYSEGPNGADDCRSGANHSSWDDTDAATKYWTKLTVGRRAEGVDCPRVGGGNVSQSLTVAACQTECFAMGFCNYINFRSHPRSCDLRRCLDPANPVLTPSPDDIGWALTLRYELEERLLPIHDGYVMFGAPNIAGNGGILYGGCGAGKDIPSTGRMIQIPQSAVPQTRFLRWQVAQSRNTETLGIRSINLELWRPIEGRKSLAVSSSSPVVAFSPARRELTTAVGNGLDLAVWDLRGIDFPAEVSSERLLKIPFSFNLSALGLLELDRVRIVDASEVPVCGDTFSAVTNAKVQGLGNGRRTSGTSNYSLWNDTVVSAAGIYRICFCGGRRTACCVQDTDFAIQLMTFVVAGASHDHYDVCEARIQGGAVLDCIIEDFRGIGIRDGDKIMLQDAPACSLAGGPIGGLPTSGVLTARSPRVPSESPVDYGVGGWYRFEQNSGIFDPGYPPGQGWRFNALTITATKGMTVRMCWCPKAANCDDNDPSAFKIFAGFLTILRFERLTTNACEIGKDCLVVVEIAPYNTPLAPGDLVMIKNGTSAPRRLRDLGYPDICQGTAVTGLGPFGDGISARMRVAKDTRPNAQITDPAAIFSLDIATAPVGTYRVCWCQASLRQCRTASEFVADIGTVTVSQAAYVWPTCTTVDPIFNGWRTWTTFDDCCCNFHEAGAVGCTDQATVTFSRCSQLPRR